MGAGLDTTGNPEDQDSDQTVTAKMAEEVVLVEPILVIGAGLVNTTGNPEDQDSAPDAHHQDSAQSSVTPSLTSSSDILNINCGSVIELGILETQCVMTSVSTAANVNKAVDSVMGAGLDTTGNPEDQDSDQTVPAKVND